MTAIIRRCLEKARKNAKHEVTFVKDSLFKATAFVMWYDADEEGCDMSLSNVGVWNEGETDEGEPLEGKPFILTEKDRELAKEAFDEMVYPSQPWNK